MIQSGIRELPPRRGGSSFCLLGEKMAFASSLGVNEKINTA
jgi:hypothetical protein